jgi:hypothetical protein
LDAQKADNEYGRRGILIATFYTSCNANNGVDARVNAGPVRVAPISSIPAGEGKWRSA